ncbi:MAG: hypothetical protein EP332_08165 [Bacteroidetes bacterium]|nr:MAG: hypothetical protein EP332_08165 [Bacteroidota bacterium]
MLKNLSIVCLLLLGASCTHKPSRTIPAEPILQLNLDDYLSKQDSITLLAKEDLRSIYLMLQDTFTDEDEKAVIELVEKSKAQGTLNSLIKCLHETALFRHMIVRWDEPYLGAESPNRLGNFLGQKDTRPKNNILPNELFRKLFLYD